VNTAYSNMANNPLEELQEEELDEEIIDLDEQELKNPGQSWANARRLDLKRTAEFITPEAVYNLMLKFKNPRDQALFAILYLTAARIEEVVRYKKIKWGKKKVKFVQKGKKFNRRWVQDYTKKKEGLVEPGIRKADISYEKQGEREIVIFNLRNLKNKQKHEKRKLIPVTLDNEIHKKFWSIIKAYLYVVGEDWKELFPFQKRNAERIINQIEWNPHFIRKVRLTHLVKYHGFIEQELRIFAGWTDTRPSKHYVKLSWEALIKKL